MKLQHFLLKIYIVLCGLFFAESQTFAIEVINRLLDNINRVLVNPLLMFGFATGVFLFLSGMLQLFIPERLRGLYPGGATPEKGRQHAQWGIIGLFLMFGVFGVMKFIAATLGTVVP